MYLHLIIALIFGAGVVSNLINKPIDWVEVSGGLMISSLMIIMFIWVKVSHRRSRRTLTWLMDNRHQITDDPKFFRNAPVFDIPVSKKTTLRSFKVVTSAILITTVDELGLEIRKGIWAGLFATAWTLIFGWWGFPWGPIRTIQALTHNLSGGCKISVAGAIISAETGWDFETGMRSR